MKQLTILLAVSTMALGSFAFAEDIETQYLPSQAEDVSKTHPARKEISRVIENFTKAIEGRDKSAFSKTVTKNFLSTTGWGKNWNNLTSTMSPDLMSFQDIFIMSLKGANYVRFSVLNKNTNKVTHLPPDTWYRIAKEDGSWKMDAFLADFSPDGGP